MVAVIVALLMIFLGFYHAWMKKIPVLAGVMVPALIMLLYAAWVMILAKREKRRRLNAVSFLNLFDYNRLKYLTHNFKQENQLRDSVSALSEVLIETPEPSIASGRRNRRFSHDRQQHKSTCKHGNPKGHNHKHRKDHHRRHHKPTCEFYEMQKSSLKRNLLAPLPPMLIPPTTHHQDSIRRPSLVRSLSAR